MTARGGRSSSTNEPAAGDRLTARVERSGARSAHPDGSTLAEPGSTRSLLVRLTSDVGDTAIVERFVLDYLSLLPARLDRLEQLLTTSDPDATRLAILSLESSSAMLGADEMAAAAQVLREAVTESRVELEQELFASLCSCADQLREQLAGLGFVTTSAGG